MTFEPRSLGSGLEIVAETRAQRVHRTEVLEQARASRMRARVLRRIALQSRDRALAQRWTLWTAGLLSEPPSLVPDSWQAELGYDPDRVLDQAALACLECRDAAIKVPDTRVLAGLADVAAARVVVREDGFEFLLSAMARLIDDLEPKLDAGDPTTVVCLSAMRRCRDACRAGLLALPD